MRRLKIIFIIMFIPLLFGFSALANKQDCADDEILKKPFMYKSMPSEGVVPDKETAKQIAEAIWKNIFKDSVESKKPYVVKYYKEDGVWFVEGTLPENTLGGVPSILINQKDGRIISVWHTK